MEALQAEQNFTATAATAATLIRVLVPVAGRVGRAAWHWWNQSTGEVRKDEDAPEVVLPDALANANEQPQQQPEQPQQQPEQVTPLSLGSPNRPGKRDRISPLYSKEPALKGNLLPAFDQVKKSEDTTTTTYQFGPARVVTKDDYSNAVQLQHDTAKTKLLSTMVGKNGPRTWGLDDDDGPQNTKTSNAIMRRMQEELDQLRKEKATWQQQQQKEQPQQTLQVTAMDTPQGPTTTIKDIMAGLQNGTGIGGTTTQNTNTQRGTTIHNGTIRRDKGSPESDDSPNDRNCGNGLYQMGNNNPNGGDGDDGDDNGVSTTFRAGGRSDERGREFSLVKSSNIIIQTFSGKNLHSSPYLPFNKSLRRLIYNQGADGEQLLEILDSVEKYGAMKFDNEKLKILTSKYHKVSEYNRAIKSLLLNYTTGIAKGMVEHGVENGLDAWRRLYHHYIPLAEDLKKILMQELYALKPVTENEIDSLFMEVERITELYLKASITEDPMLEQWVMAAILRNLPKQLTRDLALELKKAKSIDDIHNSINIYMYDHQIGMPRNMPGPMLCMAEQDVQKGRQEEQSESKNSAGADAGNSKTETAKTNNAEQDDQELYNTGKGGKGKDKHKGKGKGYGECWHCGEWGHPRRECPQFLAQQSQRGSISALKGAKNGSWKGNGKKGKGGKGQGYKGKGKNNKGGYYYNNYRSPGKGVGKGLNNMSEDWFNAWGSEEPYEYYPGDWWDQYGEQQFGYCGNLSMLLERGGRTGRTETEEKTESKGNSMHRRHTGEHDPLRNARKAQPLTLHNRYQTLNSDDNDSDTESEESDEDTVTRQPNTHKHTTTTTTTKHRPNKRQRQRRKTIAAMMSDNYNDNDHDHDHDQHGNHDNCDDSCRSSGDEGLGEYRGWHPGPEHSGCLASVTRQQTSVKENMQKQTMSNGDVQTAPWRLHKHQQCEHVHNDARQCTYNHDTTQHDNTWLKPSSCAGVIKDFNNIWLKPSSCAGQLNYLGPQSSRGSNVHCSSQCLRPSSQCRGSAVRAHWSNSSGLLAASVPCLCPHEWAPRGELRREVMSPTLISPVAKLSRPSGAGGGSHERLTLLESCADWWHPSTTARS